MATTTSTNRKARKATTTSRYYYIINDADGHVIHGFDSRTEKSAIKRAQNYLKNNRVRLGNVNHATLFADQPCGGIYRVQGYARQN